MQSRAHATDFGRGLDSEQFVKRGHHSEVHTSGQALSAMRALAAERASAVHDQPPLTERRRQTRAECSSRRCCLVIFWRCSTKPGSDDASQAIITLVEQQRADSNESHADKQSMEQCQ